AALPRLRGALAGRAEPRNLGGAGAQPLAARSQDFYAHFPANSQVFPANWANLAAKLKRIDRETPMTSRVDLHCHSTASQLSRLGVQRSLGLPECATPPQEVYELAKRRGMDFVTITDHDTIDGCLELEGRPDCFISEELTAGFAGEPQAVHVLCYGITP